MWICLIYSLLRHYCVSITLRRLKHRRFFTKSALRSSYPFPRHRNHCARVWTRQISAILHHHCISITLRRLKHRRFFTDSVLRPSHRSCYLLRRFSDFVLSKPIGWVLQRYFRLLSVLSNVGFRITSEASLWSFLSLATSILRHVLVVFVYQLVVELLYGSLLSVATSILRHVLGVFSYQLVVEFLYGCNRFCPFDL